jgi:hypothetical protein
MADSKAGKAAESDPARSVAQALDQDPAAVYFNLKGTWVEWDMRARENLVQRAAEQYLANILQLKRE